MEPNLRSRYQHVSPNTWNLELASWKHFGSVLGSAWKTRRSKMPQLMFFLRSRVGQVLHQLGKNAIRKGIHKSVQQTQNLDVKQRALRYLVGLAAQAFWWPNVVIIRSFVCWRPRAPNGPRGLVREAGRDDCPANNRRTTSYGDPDLDRVWLFLFVVSIYFFLLTFSFCRKTIESQRKSMEICFKS